MTGMVLMLAAALVRAEADFSDPKTDRLVRDFPVTLDLTHADGVEFDFQCDDFSVFQQFNCYLKSGDGWYAQTLDVDELPGAIQHLRLRKSQVKWIEGKVAGWHSVSAVRIFGYRGAARKASFAAGNFRPLDVMPGAAPGERRFIWCHSPWGLGWKDADWEKSAEMIREAGFTDVIASLAWANGACYESKVLPPSPQYAYRHEDTFDHWLAACHKRGLKLHVWMVCFNMSIHCSDKIKDGLTAAGRTQVDGKGKPNRSWLCPSHPENARQVVRALVELGKKGADGVHLDYARYPDGDYCHCVRCTEMAARYPSWDAFRCEMINRVVREASKALRRDCPGVEISAAVRGDAQNTAARDVGQDWTVWCREGWLDFVCPMDYTPFVANLRETVSTHAAKAGSVRVYPGIGDVNLWPNPARDRQRFRSSVRALREAGFGGFCFFDFSPRGVAAMKDQGL